MHRGVLAYHLILTAYGFWLPNDPRGSWSDFVRSFALYCAGGSATRVDTSRSVAHVPHDHAARRRAKDALVRPPVRFDPQQQQIIAEGLRDYCEKNNRPVLALVVMPDHVHLVMTRTDLPIEKVAEQLKARATMFLTRGGRHPFINDLAPGGRLPTPWARGSWKVYLDSLEDIGRAVRYVRDNPARSGLPPQAYDWTTEFDAREFL